MKWWTVATVAVIAAMAPQLASAEQTSCRVSLAHYKKLRFGMSYDQITAIVGCPGRNLGKSPFGPFVNYEWDGYSVGRVMYAGFKAGEGMFSKGHNLGRHGVRRRRPGLFPSGAQEIPL
jgi:hypothetical protein